MSTQETSTNKDGAARVGSATGYALSETTIEQGGVFRCCLATVATEYEGKRVNIGDKSACQHCKQSFTLVEPKDAGVTCYSNLTRPIWKPDWQLSRHNGPSEPLGKNHAHSQGG